MKVVLLVGCKQRLLAGAVVDVDAEEIDPLGIDAHE